MRNCFFESGISASLFSLGSKIGWAAELGELNRMMDKARVDCVRASSCLRVILFRSWPRDTHRDSCGAGDHGFRISCFYWSLIFRSKCRSVQPQRSIAFTIYWQTGLDLASWPKLRCLQSSPQTIDFLWPLDTTFPNLVECSTSAHFDDIWYKIRGLAEKLSRQAEVKRLFLPAWFPFSLSCSPPLSLCVWRMGKNGEVRVYDNPQSISPSSNRGFHCAHGHYSCRHGGQ